MSGANEACTIGLSIALQRPEHSKPNDTHYATNNCHTLPHPTEDWTAQRRRCEDNCSWRMQVTSMGVLVMLVLVVHLLVLRC